jgi:hypothetical protein
MNYTLKNAILAITAIAILLAALISKSPILIEVATATVMFSIPTALVFALCDSQHNRRPFWIGFFILGASSLFLSSYGDIFASASSSIAEAVCGPIDYVDVDPSTANIPPQYMPGPEFQLVSLRSPSINYNDRLNLLIQFVPTVFSTLFGIVGGLLALWISRRPPSDQSKSAG